MADNTINLGLRRPEVGELVNEWGITALNYNFGLIDDRFGALDGHGHTGQAGDGPQIRHGSLLDVGSLSHVAIEATLASLQDQISDIELVDVEAVDSNGNVVSSSTITDVNTIQFVRCDVVPGSSAGVVKVTPQVPQSDAYEVTAPVNHFDAFVGPAGTTLAVQGWERLSPPTQGTFDIQDTSNGLVANVGYPYWSERGANSGIYAATTSLQYQLGGAVPHSEVQRVGVVVEKAEFEGDPAILAEEQITARAGILGSVTSPGNTTVVRGLYLEITRQNGVVGAEFVALSQSTAQRHTILGPSQQPWTAKPADYLLGQHEISLSRDSVTNTYYLHYYYNKSLIYKYAEPLNGDLFFDTVRQIISELEADAAAPDFGQFQFGVTLRDCVTAASAEDATPRPVTVLIDSVMASSTGDRINPKFISSGFGGESGSPPDPGQEVCSSFDPNPYEGLSVGDPFQPVNGGPPLTVTAAGPNYFIATDSQGDLFTFYCTGAGGGNPGTGTGAGETGGEATVDNDGTNNLQVGAAGQYATTTFTANVDVPTNWKAGNLNPSSVYAAGDPLPADFIAGTAFMAEVQGTGEGGSLGSLAGRPKFNFSTGTRLPLGTQISATVDVTYDKTEPLNDNVLTSTFSNLVTVEAVAPSNITTKAFRFNNGGWSLITSANQAVRGDGLALTVSGKNLPLDGFWAPNVGFQRDYRVDNNALTELIFGTGILEDEVEYFSSFELGSPAQVVSGPMPAGPVAQQSPSSARPITAPTVTTGGGDEETLMVVGRLSRCPIAGPMQAVFTDGGGGNTVVDLFGGGQFISLLTTANVLGAVQANTVGETVQVLINYPNPRVALLPGDQFTISSTSTAGNTITDVTYAPVQDGGPGEPWSVLATLTIDTGNAGTLQLVYNDGCGVVGVAIAVTSGPVVPSDPDVPQGVIAEPALYQCEPRNLTFSIPAANITAGDILSITPVAGTCTLNEPDHTFSTSEAAGGYSTTLVATGIVGQTPQIEVEYTRPGASNTSSQTLTLSLDVPSSMSISGEGNYNYGQVVNGVLDVDLTIVSAAPWRPGVSEVTVTDNSTLGTAVLAPDNPIQDLGNGAYRFRLALSDVQNWATNEEVTLTIPNHDTCPADAGTTSFTFSLTVNSGITVVRSGQIYNRFPYNVIVEGAGPADEGKVIKFETVGGVVLADLGTLQQADIRNATGGGTEAVLEGVHNWPFSAFQNDVTQTVNPMLRVGDEVYPVMRSVSGGFQPLSVGYLAPPETLEAAFVGIGDFESPLSGVSEGSTIQVLVQSPQFAFVKPSAHTVTGNLSGSQTAPAVSFQATWTFDGGTLNSVTEVTPPSTVSPSRTRQFNLDLGQLSGLTGTLNLELRQIDPNEGLIEVQSFRTYSSLIAVAPSDPGGGGPITNELNAGF